MAWEVGLLGVEPTGAMLDLSAWRQCPTVESADVGPQSAPADPSDLLKLVGMATLTRRRGTVKWGQFL